MSIVLKEKQISMPFPKIAKILQAYENQCQRYCQRAARYMDYLSANISHTKCKYILKEMPPLQVLQHNPCSCFKAITGDRGSVSLHYCNFEGLYSRH